MLFSAALCRGLIEAFVTSDRRIESDGGFPRLYAAASLKLEPRASGGGIAHGFSAALCRGLIEA